MDLFSVITLVGGLAFFLYGMNVMSTGLEKMAGSRLEGILQKLTAHPFKGLLLGVGITCAIQSSSAVTVMLVGLVNSGIMQFGQTIGVIMGSNIGTTITAWLLSLTGIESDNPLVLLLKPASFAPILAFIGIALLMVSKSTRKKDVGTVLIGFGVLMYGMELMSGAVQPLADVPEFTGILTMFSNPLLGILVGAVFTAVIQSSSASVGILQAISLTGSLTYATALPIIMGQNIGTCITAVLSCIGANRNAKRVAAVHLMFNLFGAVICLVPFYVLNAFLHFSFLDQQVAPLGIAVVHTVFNLATTAVLFPLSRKLGDLAFLVIRDKKGKQASDALDSYEFLDERLLRSPSFALAQCRTLTVQMAQLARDTLLAAMQMLGKFSDKLAEAVTENEELIDLYEDKLGSYLVKLSSKALSKADSREVSLLLHTIGDFERIGDHAVNVLDTAKELHSKGLSFSKAARGELEVLQNAVTDIIDRTTDAFVQNDASAAAEVEPLEQVIDEVQAEIKSRHIERLQAGQCTIELGFVLSDLLNDYERVSDHCSNIAVSIIRIRENLLDAHDYLHDLKTSGSPVFQADYERFQQQYGLPAGK